MRLDLEEGGRLFRKSFFIVNTVLDACLRIVRIVAGDPIEAHREGIKISAEMCGVKIPRQADVVITNSYPMNLDLRQGLKALANTIRAVRPGGLIIDLVRAEEGVGDLEMGHRKSWYGRRTVKLLSPLLLQLLPRWRSNEQGEEFKFFTYFALQALRRNSMLIYVPTVPEEFAAGMPFAEFSSTIDEMWAKARRGFPDRADVLVFPAGGITYPVP